MIKEAIAQLIEREDLTQEEAQEVMGVIMRGEAPDFPAGLSLGAQSLDSGRAREKLQELVAFTQGEG